MTVESMILCRRFSWSALTATAPMLLAVLTMEPMAPNVPRREAMTSLGSMLTETAAVVEIVLLYVADFPTYSPKDGPHAVVVATIESEKARPINFFISTPFCCEKCHRCCGKLE